MIEKMPEEYKGEIKTQTEYTKTPPREWTEKEIEWVKMQLDNGYTAKEIAYSMDRSHTSVAIKIKRLGKKENTYNSKHVEEKYKINNDFLQEIKPKTILDVYAGNCFYNDNYKNAEIITNDINEEKPTQYHMDALRLLCKLYAENKTFDLIDLDPYGSAYDCLDLAIKMIKCGGGLSVTLGELGHKRWKRLDFVNRYYGITQFEDFTIDNLIKHIQQIGLKNKKNLIVYQQKEWQNIGRVWFKVEQVKILESQVKTETRVNTQLTWEIGD